MEARVHRRIGELRLACSREIDAHREAADRAAAAFRRSLQPIRSGVEKTLANREKLRKIKDHLNELEGNLEKVLSAKICKELGHKNAKESLFTTKSRIEELNDIVQKQTIRKEEYQAVISQQLLALEALRESSQDDNDRENLVDAISWYDKVLGFKAMGGEGVTFRFKKIDWKNPEKEFSLTVRLEGDTYRLVQCDPKLQDTSKLVDELNQTNGLFKFVRTMRENFQDFATKESLPTKNIINPDSTTISISSPPSMSTDSQSMSSPPSWETNREVQPKKEVSGLSTMVDRSVGGSHAKSQQSITAIRRSPRFQPQIGR